MVAFDVRKRKKEEEREEREKERKEERKNREIKDEKEEKEREDGRWCGGGEEERKRGAAWGLNGDGEGTGIPVGVGGENRVGMPGQFTLTWHGSTRQCGLNG